MMVRDFIQYNMILTKNIIIIGHVKNISYYKNLGYDIFIKKPCEINIIDLMSGSPIKVDVRCDICNSNKLIEYRQYYQSTDGLTSKYYCYKCSSKKTKENLQKNYGVDNVMQLESSKKSYKNTIQEKYGVDHYSQTDEYKQKYKNTINDLYGVDNIFQSVEIKETIKETNRRKYNVDYPQQNIDIINKSYKKTYEKYGVNRPLQNKDILNKLQLNSLDKTGYLSNIEDPIIRERAKQSTFDRYGVDHYYSNIEYQVNRSLLLEKQTVDKYSLFLNKTYSVLSYNNGNFKIKHNDHHFEIFRDLFYTRNRDHQEVCTTCNPINKSYSLGEKEISDFIKSLNIDIIENDKKILGGLELDIYLPRYKIAIEYNGLYWHSEKYKGLDYHKNKTLLCKELGIDLIHVFEDDWLYKNEIIKSIIRNRLCINDKNIYARKCEIRLVSSSDARKFLDCNHIQGFCRSSIKIGLYNQGTLVSLMTFGERKTNSKSEFELVRFCSLINHNVVGGSSKLWKYFLNNYPNDRIVSYSDISLFNGDMYTNLGFDYKWLSSPNYFWVVDGKRNHRWKYNKKVLIKEGFDPQKTEVEIMTERKYYRIWGCGQVRFEYIRKN